MNEDAKTILVVDDEHDLTDAIQAALEGAGFNVLVEHKGEDGLRSALEEQPDLVFLDIEMPDKTGTEVLRALRADERGANIPVIIMTVVEDMEKIAEVVESRGDAYVFKNHMDLSELVRMAEQRLIRDT